MVDEAAVTFRDGLQEILTEYPTPEHIGKDTEFETAHSDHPMYQLVVDRVGGVVDELIDTDTYSTKASVGRGTPTYIPYASVFT